MNNIEEKLKLSYAKMSPQRFEDVCKALMPLVSAEYENINSNKDALGKTKKGTPDAYVRDSNGYYVAFQFTTQQDRVKEKVITDIGKLNSKNCHFSDKIRKVVICLTANMSSEIELCHKEAEKYGWSSDIYTLDDMVRISEGYSQFCHEHLRVFIPSHIDNAVVPERFYLCGSRIRELREERNLLPSQFIDLIDYYSELSWSDVETEKKECELSIAKYVSDITGANLSWVIHGIGSKYTSDFLPYYSIYDSVEMIKSLSPMKLYFCINTETCDFMIVAMASEYKWKIFYLNYRLDFWNWLDDHNKIPEIYEHFTTIYNKFNKLPCSVIGRLYKDDEFKMLTSDNVFLGELINKLPKRGEYWADDIRDLEHRYSHLDYEHSYGQWFVDIQSYVRRNKT
ncbi:hypothetical protein GNP79_12140 [Aliivibrio fischeri]|uniref:Uncharacterized protein n=1 Tax=Aliivibrio fischeri TaxID=668 RepID=A0A6N3Z8K9_ALIFS|nr:hypothetical protein [Aliivibrio fischeri]MUK47550.1 hypothetical protein [Aliivibrio fischeri]MUK81540.1 hypothetical protein [Aliivibrio fischeri]MUK86586.1 hypothetical protein [Aliivibrio fischeri]